MKTHSFSRLALIACCVLHCSTAQGGRPVSGTAPEVIERLLPRHVGASILAIDQGEVVFEHSWGWHQLGRTRKCTSSTNYRLASVSKQFTATCVLLLEEEGAVALSDTLDSFFPRAPAFWQRITVEHLLTHTSGLPDYEDLIPEGTAIPLSDLNVLTLLHGCEAPLFEPGSKFSYSNSGYALLGLLVEQVSHQPFHHFMQERLFQPSGMGRSVLHVRGLNSIAQRAMGHSFAGEAWKETDQSITSAIRGDGGVYSSLDDLHRWLEVLAGGQGLSDELRHKLFTRRVKSDRGNSWYGYGWFLDSYRGQPRTMHGGSSLGFSTMLQRFPEREAAVVILLNRSAGADTTRFAEQVVDVLLFSEGQRRE